MRMRELEDKSGMSRTAIHHYLREGLLPSPKKTAANAALYDETHVERLKQIRDLRSGHHGPLSLSSIKRILSRIEAGQSSLAAISLESLPDVEVGDSGPFSPATLATAANVDPRFIQELRSAGVLPGLGSGEIFDGADLKLVRTCAELFASTPLEAEDFAPYAELIFETVTYEYDVARLLKASGSRSVVMSGQLGQALRVLRTYLFARAADSERETSV